MKFCLALVLALFSSLVYAVDCEPTTSYSLNAKGSKLVSLKNENGTVDAYWCPVLNSAGNPAFKRQYHIVLDKYKSLAYGLEATRRVLAANSFLDALNDEITQNSIKPNGPVETFQYKQLEYIACLKLITPPHDVPIILPDTVQACGLEPVMPTVPIDTYKTPLSGSFSLFAYSNGRLTGLISGRKASPNVLCNCVTSKYVNLSKTFCALQQGVANEVTECVKVP